MRRLGALIRGTVSGDILSLAAPPAGERIAYGSDPLQFGDVRLPAGPGPHPLVVYVHGGFWRAQYDLAHASHPCAALTAAGIATWNIEYRRVGCGGGWPATFHDVAAAADHVRSLAPRHNLDLNRVIAMGHSAGGHLAFWLAARPKIPMESPLHQPDPLALHAAVSVAGVVDLRRAWDLQLGGGVVRDLMGGTPDQCPDRYAGASPVELLPLGTRQVLIHGVEDSTVPYEMSVRYRDTAVAAGDEARVVALPGAGHLEPVDPRSRAWPAVLTTVQNLFPIP